MYTDKDDYDFVITNQTITIFKGGDSRSIHKTYPRYKEIRELILSDKVGSLVEAYNMTSLPAFIEKFTEGDITVDHEEGSIYYHNFKIEHSLVDRILGMLTSGDKNTKPFIRFLDRLLRNPKKNVVEELYSFMDHNSIEINQDGYIIAYKGITSDYKDVYTESIDNSVGRVVKIPRTFVDDDPTKTCSHGLHVAAKEYAQSWGSVLVKVKVCPSNVVSVPVDYSGMKMRVCEYEVLPEIAC